MSFTPLGYLYKTMIDLLMRPAYFRAYGTAGDRDDRQDDGPAQLSGSALFALPRAGQRSVVFPRFLACLSAITGWVVAHQGLGFIAKLPSALFQHCLSMPRHHNPVLVR